MRNVLLLIALTLGLSADIGVEFFGKSYHFNRDREYNEDQKYLGLVYRPNDTNFEIGVSTFENSHYERSNAVYIGYQQPLYEADNTEFGIFADVGYQSGYDGKPMLFYGGVYGEYKNIYMKLTGTDKLIAVTFGYNLDTGF